MPLNTHSQEEALTYADVTGEPTNPMHERLNKHMTLEERTQLDTLREAYKRRRHKFSSSLKNDTDKAALRNAWSVYINAIWDMAARYPEAEPVGSRDHIDLSPTSFSEEKAGLGAMPFIAANMHMSGLKAIRAMARAGATGVSMQERGTKKQRKKLKTYATRMQKAHPVYEETALLTRDMNVTDYLRFIQRCPEALALVLKGTREKFRTHAKVVGIFGPDEFARAGNENMHIGDLYTHIDEVPTLDPFESDDPQHIAMQTLCELVGQNRQILPVIDDGKAIGVASQYAMGHALRFVPHQNPINGGLAYMTSLSPINTPIDFIREMIEKKRLGVGISFDVHHIDRGTQTYRFLQEVRNAIDELQPELVLSAGNVASVDGALRLAATGVDMIKVGIGPAESCITREQAGYGVPQFDIVREISDALDTHGYGNIRVIADGGVDIPGFASKALGAGGDYFMTGTKLGLTHESSQVIDRFDMRNFYGTQHPGETVWTSGSAAAAAQLKPDANVDSMSPEQLYRVTGRKRVEGATSRQPMSDHFRTVRGYLQYMMDGASSGVFFSGADDIREHQEFYQYRRQTNAGIREGGDRHKKA